MARVALAPVEPARGGYVEVENRAGEEVFLWVSVDGCWPPVAREEQHRLVRGARRRFGPGVRFEAIAQSARDGDAATASTPEELIPNIAYVIVALKGTLGFATRRSEGDLVVPTRGLGVLSERKLRMGIAEQLGIPFLDLTERFADPNVATSVAGKFCGDNKVLPLHRVNDRLVVAMVDPTDQEAIDGLQFLTGYKVDAVLVTPGDFKRTLEFFH